MSLTGLGFLKPIPKVFNRIIEFHVGKMRTLLSSGIFKNSLPCPLGVEE